MSNNSEDMLKLAFIVIGLILAIACFYIWKLSGFVGLDFATTFKVIVGLIITAVIGYFANKFGLPKTFIFPLIGVAIVISLLPALNDYALQASNKTFNESINYLGQVEMNLSALEVTVFWGKWYMQLIYVVMGGVLGVIAQKAFSPEY